MLTPFPASIDASGPPPGGSMQDRVYRQIRDGLMSGRFEPGEKLTIRGIAAALGSSPMPVREALHRLQAERAFDVTDTARLRVRSMTPALLCEIRDARVALEGLLAEAAARLVGPDDLEEITLRYRQLEAAVESHDRRSYLWSNFAFHRAVYLRARREITLSAAERFWLMIGPSFTLLAPDEAHLQASMAVHAQILAALRAHDGAAAREAVAADIIQAADSLLDLLRERRAPRQTSPRQGRAGVA